MFYKYENKQLISGLSVQFPDGSFLHLDHLDTYVLPVNNYYYFGTEEEAKNFFGIKDEE
jgi:hypothetical protein